MPSRFLVALPQEDIVDDSLDVQTTELPTLPLEHPDDTGGESSQPSSSNQPQSDAFAELLDVDADKENVPPVEAGLLLNATLTCDEELSKTLATPFLALEFEQLGVSSEDEEEPKSDPEEVAGMGDDSSSSGEEEDELPVERPPLALSVLLGHKERLALKKRISTYCTKWGQAFTFDDWEETKSETPMGAVLPLPPQETLDVDVLAVTESPSPLAQMELPAEALNAVQAASDPAAAPDVDGAGSSGTRKTPLTGSRDFPIELLPDPQWGDSGVVRVG
ncbi:hypothetical protein FRC01_000060 [Tulasnella sp. 417]|nr:hypothetical protein FRC01_000060 [Tulasnella sp. 417]